MPESETFAQQLPRGISSLVPVTIRRWITVPAEQV